jgi:uncharacterized coiled-coil DUF342 family protein
MDMEIEQIILEDLPKHLMEIKEQVNEIIDEIGYFSHKIEEIAIECTKIRNKLLKLKSEEAHG